MPRILGLDVGDNTIGIAITDELGTLAFPRDTLIRTPGSKRDMAALREIISDNQVQEIVIGLPLTLSGEIGPQAEKVQEFVRRLRGSVRIPIRFQDERMTTAEADRVLIEAGQSRSERKRVVDSVAAALILESYLARRAGSSNAMRSTDGG